MSSGRQIAGSTSAGSIYGRFVLPRLIDFAMRRRIASRFREQLIPDARGRVLEIGIGSGLNLPFYSRSVEQLCGIDPSTELLRMARRRSEGMPFDLELLPVSSEQIPFDDGSFDTVVTTWTLCSIPDATRALREMRRVLKRDGMLVFVEHGLSPDTNIRRWQNRLNPTWQVIAGGCQLNRDMNHLIGSAGFRFIDLEASYVEGRNPWTYMYRGHAAPVWAEPA